MGSICQDLLLSSLLSLSLSLNPTVTMLFLPRLTLLLFIAFLGFCCPTHVKADNLPDCKSELAKCGTNEKWTIVDCKYDGKLGQGNECYAYCGNNDDVLKGEDVHEVICGDHSFEILE